MSDAGRRVDAQRGLIFDFGELISEALAERGWSRERLAAVLGVGVAVVEGWMYGTRVATLLDVGDVLHVMGYSATLHAVDQRQQCVSPPVDLRCRDAACVSCEPYGPPVGPPTSEESR